MSLLPAGNSAVNPQQWRCKPSGAERSHFGVSVQLDITLSRFKSSHLGQSHENRNDIEIIYIYIIYYNIMLNYVFHSDCMYVPLSYHVLLVSCSFYSPTVSNSTFCGQDLELVSKVQLVMSRRTLRRAAFRLVLIRRWRFWRVHIRPVSLKLSGSGRNYSNKTGLTWF